MSRKKRAAAVHNRDAPTKSVSTAWLCSDRAWSSLVESGYRRLSDCPEVQMCVRKYADLISSMTLYLMRNTFGGDVRVKNRLSRKLDIEPHPYMTRKAWMYTIVQTLLLDGDGNQITFPRYTADGLIDALEPLPPSSVQLAETEGSYRIHCNGRVYAPDEVLHFTLHPDPDQPWRGTGYRTLLHDVAKGLRQAGETRRKLLESPAPSIIVKVDGLAEEFASVEGRRALRKQYLDSSEHGEPWFIPAEAFEVQTVKPLTMNDLAIAQGMEIDKRTVAGIFGVPPALLGVGTYDKAEYNNFIISCVMPLAKAIEQELTRKLLISEEMYFRFNQNSLFAYDISEIITAGSEMVDRMAMTRNEWRAWVGYGPDERMEELLALENYIPQDMLGQQKKLLQDGGGGDGQGNDANPDNDG